MAQVVKNPPANAGDARALGSIPGFGRSPGVGNGDPHQYTCLENSMDRGAWQTTVHGVSKSRTRLSAHAGVCTHTHTHIINCSHHAVHDILFYPLYFFPAERLKLKYCHSKQSRILLGKCFINFES